jgi:hypothetical protein
MRQRLTFIEYRRKKNRPQRHLKQAKEEALEQRRFAQQEKDDLQAKFEEDREQIQKEKEQLLAEQIGVKEVVTRALHSVSAWHRWKKKQLRAKWGSSLKPFSSSKQE